jgi:tetratricopeptide (TPR) repeat protein
MFRRSLLAVLVGSVVLTCTLGVAVPEAMTQKSNLATLKKALDLSRESLRLFEAGRTAEAIKKLGQRQALLLSIYPPDHKLILSGWRLMASLSRSLGRTADAAKYEKMARGGGSSRPSTGGRPSAIPTVPGNVHYKVHNLRRMVRVGKLIKQRRETEALPLAQQGLSLAIQRHGPRHGDVVYWLGTLSWIYERLGRLDNALSFQKRAWEMSRELEGPRSLNVARNALLLGLIYSRKGDHRRARRLISGACALRLEKLGAQHEDTRRCQRLLRTVGPSSGRSRQASQVKSMLVDMVALYKSGRYGETIARGQKLKDMLSRTLGNRHEYVGQVWLFLGMSHQKQGDMKTATACLERGLDILKDAWGWNDKRTYKIRGILMMNYLKMKQKAKVMAVLQKTPDAYLRLVKIPPSPAPSRITPPPRTTPQPRTAPPPRTAPSPRTAPPPRTGTNAPSDRQEVLKLTQKVLGLMSRKKYSQALEPARRALRLRIKTYGADNLMVTTGQILLARVHLGLRQYGPAVDLLKKCLAILNGSVKRREIKSDSALFDMPRRLLKKAQAGLKRK